MNITNELYIDPEVIYKNHMNTTHSYISSVPALYIVKREIRKNPELRKIFTNIEKRFSEYVSNPKYVYTYRHGLSYDYTYCNYIVVLEDMNQDIKIKVNDNSKDHITSLNYGSNLKIVCIFNPFDFDDQIGHIIINNKWYKINEIVNNVDYYKTIYVPFFKGCY